MRLGIGHCMALAHKIPVEVATGTMALLVVFGSPRNILPKPCKPSKLLKKKRQDSYDLFVKPLQKETSKPPDSLNPKPLWPFKNLKAPPPHFPGRALRSPKAPAALSRAEALEFFGVSGPSGFRVYRVYRACRLYRVCGADRDYSRLIGFIGD